MPISDSDQAIVLDIMGIVRKITLDGIFSGTDVECATFINLIEGILNGNQSTRNFASDSTGLTIKVILSGWECHVEEGVINRVYYNLELTEAIEVTSLLRPKCK
jgi:hypothetical protein